MKKIRMTAMLLAVGLSASACSSGEVGPDSTSEKEGNVAGEISVSCYDSGTYRAFLEEAAKLFEVQYPEVKVTIDSFSEMPEVRTSEQDGENVTMITSEDDPQGRADYISKTSTALMSGKGADLLAMDVLPIYKYVESGQLVNLKEYMEQDQDFNRSDYRANILDAVEFQNGTWFLPLDYGFGYYTYDVTLIDGQQYKELGMKQAITTKQLAELGKLNFDGSNRIFSAAAYSPDGDGTLFHRRFKENYRDFVDVENKIAYFTNGEFKELITGLGELVDEGYIAKGLDRNVEMEDVGNLTKRFLFKPKSNISLIQQTYPDPDMNMMFSSANVEAGIEKDDEIAGIMSEESGVIPFSYSLAFGINSNSPNKDTAWAFLKFLLSYEIQASPSMSLVSLPVHNEARRANAESLYSMLLAEGGSLDAAQQLALDNYMQAIEVMSDQINGYTISDTTIEDMVVQEAGYYFDASKSADEVCQSIQNKVGLYLNE